MLSVRGEKIALGDARARIKRQKMRGSIAQCAAAAQISNQRRAGSIAYVNNGRQQSASVVAKAWRLWRKSWRICPNNRVKWRKRHGARRREEAASGISASVASRRKWHGIAAGIMRRRGSVSLNREETKAWRHRWRHRRQQWRIIWRLAAKVSTALAWRKWHKSRKYQPRKRRKRIGARK